MTIFNSTDIFLEYIERLEFTIIYKENSLPIPIKGNINTSKDSAVGVLLGAALSGNKAIGFFHKVPRINCKYPLRETCVFISNKFSGDIDIPTFLIKDAEKLKDILPKAIQLSADWGFPISIVISDNAMNNYVKGSIIFDEFGKISPYLSKDLQKWDVSTYKAKMDSFYDQVHNSLNISPLNNDVSFNLPEASFPSFLLPHFVEKQKSIFSEIKYIDTTPEESREIEYLLLNLGINLEIRTNLKYMHPPVRVSVCPGCPFNVIFSGNRMEGKTVFSSLRCLAIKNKFGIKEISFQEFKGLSVKKLNTDVVFIGDISGISMSEFGHTNDEVIIALIDSDTRTNLPLIKNIFKFRALGFQVFPYSCNNIKRYAKLKYNVKKCTCTKTSGSPVCITASGCVSLNRDRNAIFADPSTCTGCRACVPLCAKGALY